MSGPVEHDKDVGGVWVAFNWDGSAFVPFATEVDALRYAIAYHMNVTLIAFGDADWMQGAK